MSAQASLSARPTTPAGAEAGCATPSTLLLLFIIRLFIAWAEDVAASIRERIATADISDLLREFGTTDTALLLARFTVGLQRLRALEAEVLAGPPNLTTDPQCKPTGAIASPRIPSAPEPPTLAPPTSRWNGAPPHRSAPPARPRTPSQSEKTPNGAEPSSHTLGGMVGPAMPIPRPAQSSAAR